MAEEKCAEVEESVCKELLEQLGYIVDMPRKITENQACVGNRLRGIMVVSPGMSAAEVRERMGRAFTDATKQCVGVFGTQTKEREQMLAILRKEIERLTEVLKRDPKLTHIEGWIKEKQSKIRRIEAGMP